MVKFAMSSSNGRLLVALGLTDENLRRLPTSAIMFVLAELLPPEMPIGKVDVMIFHGPTEAAIQERLTAEGLITTSTKIVDRRNITKSGLH